MLRQRRLVQLLVVALALFHAADASCPCTAASGSEIESSALASVRKYSDVYGDTSAGDAGDIAEGNCTTVEQHIAAYGISVDYDSDFFATFDVSDILSATSTATSVVLSLNATIFVANTTEEGLNETLIVHFDLVDAYGTVNCNSTFSNLTYGSRVSRTLSNLTGGEAGVDGNAQIVSSPDLSAVINALIDTVCPSTIAVRVSVSNTTAGSIGPALGNNATLTATATCPSTTTTGTADAPVAEDHSIGAGYVVVAGVAVALVVAFSGVAGFFG